MKPEDQATSANSRGPSRRQFLQHGGALAAGSVLAGVSIPHVHAADNNTIRLALIGCGGRGSGAVANAMNSLHGPVKLYAMADVVDTRLANAHKALSPRFRRPGRRSPGAAVRGLRRLQEGRRLPGAWRRGHVDQLRLRPSSATGIRGAEGRERVHGEVVRRRCSGPAAPIKAGEEAQKKNLKIAAGLQCRHSVNRQELIKRIRDGAGRHPAGAGLPSPSGRRHGPEARQLQ